MTDARQGAGAVGVGEPSAHSTPSLHDPQRAAAAIAAALTCLPARPAGELAGELAMILRARLPRAERLLLAGAGLMALPAGDAEDLVRATWRDIRAAAHIRLDRVGATVAIERERQRRQWARHCRRSSYRSPPLTAAQRRRATNHSLDDSPRAALARAWSGASERDRRDLIRRATGRTP